MDALIRTVPELEGYVSLGHSTDQDTASFVVMNVSFCFELKEEEKKRRETLEKDKMEEGSINPMILSLTALSLTAKSSWNRNLTEYLEFKDTKYEPLETKLDKVIIEMFVSANKIIANDELYNRELESK